MINMHRFVDFVRNLTRGRSYNEMDLHEVRINPDDYNGMMVQFNTEFSGRMDTHMNQILLDDIQRSLRADFIVPDRNIPPGSVGVYHRPPNMHRLGSGESGVDYYNPYAALGEYSIPKPKDPKLDIAKSMIDNLLKENEKDVTAQENDAEVTV